MRGLSFMFSQMTPEDRRASSEAATRKDTCAVVSIYWLLVYRVISSNSSDRGERSVVAQFNSWFAASWQGPDHYEGKGNTNVVATEERLASEGLRGRITKRKQRTSSQEMEIENAAILSLLGLRTTVFIYEERSGWLFHHV